LYQGNEAAQEKQTRAKNIPTRRKMYLGSLNLEASPRSESPPNGVEVTLRFFPN